MLHVQNGQCGLCSHFGEHEESQQQIVTQIRVKHEAPADLVEKCGHPKHAPLHLIVTPNSGCDGFEPTPSVQ